jgi:uncharacterized Zn-binding protein involved in type VI secretion
MGSPVARLGDGSSHGGVITTAASANSKCEGKRIARVGDLHSCPIPGHGTTAITTGSPQFKCEGQPVARSGSVCGCGAVIIGGAAQTVCE